MTRTALAVRHVLFEDLGTLAPALEQRGYRIDYVEAGLQPLADEAMVRADVLIVLGGPIGLADGPRYPYLYDELRAIRTRLDHGLPTLGICLGAQLIASALGAPVRPTGRVEIGFSPLRLTGAGRESVLCDLGETPVLHWHGDEFDIPDGAERLAETPGFPHQAFTYGGNVLALQPHLEADHRYLERWLIGHAHELATHRVDIVRLRDDALRHGPGLACAGAGVLGRWLDQLE